MSTLRIACATDVGRVRQANEDAFVNADHPDPVVTAARGRLLVVADGMGGALGGGTASNLAAHTLALTWFSETEKPVALALADAVHAANAEIHRQASVNEHLRGMGSTLTAAAILGHQVWLAQVGDSRGYLIRGGRAEQLTRDHSKVGMLLHEGLITPEQAANHPERNVILRSLGPHPTVEVDVTGPYELLLGDALLLCSDGLHGHLRGDELGSLVVGTPERVVASLIKLANDRGGEDNITVALAVLGELPAARRVPITRPGADVGDTVHGLPALRSTRWTRRQTIWLVALVVTALALLGVVVFREMGPGEPAPKGVPPSAPYSAAPPLQDDPSEDGEEDTVYPPGEAPAEGPPTDRRPLPNRTRPVAPPTVRGEVAPGSAGQAPEPKDSPKTAPLSVVAPAAPASASAGESDAGEAARAVDPGKHFESPVRTTPPKPVP